MSKNSQIPTQVLIKKNKNKILQKLRHRIKLAAANKLTGEACLPIKSDFLCVDTTRDSDHEPSRHLYEISIPQLHAK